MIHTPGRNDPCPCGSGKKYKHCHESPDREAARSSGIRLLGGASKAAGGRQLGVPPAGQLNRVWEVDVVPIPAGLGGDPAARLVALMVVAPPFVLTCEMANRLSAEPQDIADRLTQEVLLAVKKSGVAPSRIAIRHASLLDSMADALRSHGIAVSLQPLLNGVMDAVYGLLTHAFGGLPSVEILRSEPETWAGWDMPSERVAQMFEAAAAFHRAAPWDKGLGELPIFVSRHGGHEWAAVVLGAAGEQTGLSLYHDLSDLARMSNVDHHDPSALTNAMRGETLAVIFNKRTELPKRMRDEIKSARWEVAATNAYPMLVALNTVGGGVRAQHFDELIAVLHAIPRFIDEHLDVLMTGIVHNEHLSWTDADTGVTCRVEVDEGSLHDFTAPIVELQLAGAEGTGAQPLATISVLSTPDAALETLLRYGEWLRAPKSGKAPSAATVQKYVNGAREFVESCMYASFKPISAVNEYDLRQYLYDWYPRNEATSGKAARAHLKELARFFTFLEESDDVRCPWAWPILGDVATMDTRYESLPPGFDDEEDVELWRTGNTINLAVRLLIPHSPEQMGVPFGIAPPINDVELLLSREAHRLWLATRDDALRAGLPLPGDVLAFIVERQQAWANAPHPDYDGLTPLGAIAGARSGAVKAKHR